MKPRGFSTYRAKDGWRWRVVAKNGRVVGASSEAFTTRAGARANAKRLLAELRYEGMWDGGFAG